MKVAAVPVNTCALHKNRRLPGTATFDLETQSELNRAPE